MIVERRRLAERWRSERWDSLHFQFPNWSFQLPGHHYVGDAPDAFAHYSEVVRYLEAYADTIGAPLRCGVDVASLMRDPATGRFRIATPDSVLEASRVVIATGPFQRPMIRGSPRCDRPVSSSCIRAGTATRTRFPPAPSSSGAEAQAPRSLRSLSKRAAGSEP